MGENFLIQSLIGKEIKIGFGRDTNRLAIEWEDSGITFFATKDTIETAEKEPITIGITPGKVVCEEAGWLFPYQFLLKLGRHRFLTAISQVEGIMRVIYLPDEEDIETGSSEFMRLCR